MKKGAFNTSGPPRRRNSLSQSGQSLFEILIALGIFSLVVSAVFSLFFGGQSLSIDSSNAQSAIEYATEGIEAAKSIKDRSWSELAEGTHGLVFNASEWQFSSSSDSKSIFTRTVTITASSTDSAFKEIKTTISWEADGGRILTTEYISQVTNWQAIINTGGDTGGSEPMGNWHNPQTLGSVDLGAGNSATDLDVIQKYVYITAEAADNKKKDFYIINATNGQSPVVVSSINTGTGLIALDAAGNYAYVGTKYTNEQLQIIDVSNKNNPFLTASYQLPGVSGNGAVGRSIFFYANKIYIGTDQAVGPEFHIIDVTTPSNPSSLGNKEIGANVNSIYINDQYAYLATSDSNELQIFDISNPAQITLVGSYNASGEEDGKIVTILSNKLFMGRLLGGNDLNNHELLILDIVNPLLPQFFGSKDLGANLNDLKSRGDLAFVGTNDANKEFQVWNIADPATPVLYSFFNFPQVASGIDYEDNIVYVSVRSNDALRIITSQ